MDWAGPLTEVVQVTYNVDTLNLKKSTNQGKHLGEDLEDPGQCENVKKRRTTIWQWFELTVNLKQPCMRQENGDV